MSEATLGGSCGIWRWRLSNMQTIHFAVLRNQKFALLSTRTQRSQATRLGGAGHVPIAKLCGGGLPSQKAHAQIRYPTPFSHSAATYAAGSRSAPLRIHGKKRSFASADPDSFCRQGEAGSCGNSSIRPWARPGGPRLPQVRSHQSSVRSRCESSLRNCARP